MRFMYIHRAIEPSLAIAISQFPAVLITGPRQTGKSTLVRHALPKYTYVTLDDSMARAMAVQDPELFLSAYPEPLIIDEIQYAPELFSYLKLRIDQDRQKYGRYVLTGSQTFQLMKGVSESLAGRIALLQLYPLSWEELSPSPPGDAASLQQIVQGFYPQFQIEPLLNRHLWFSAYVAAYLERDVRNIKAISDLSRFQMFLSSLAVRAGQLLNMAEVARECSISEPTVKDWLSILEATYVIFLLRPYHLNRIKRQVKSPKVFFVDTGLLCHLLGIDDPSRLQRMDARGHIFENMVIAEAIKKASHRLERTEFFFYRTAGGVEVDLLVEQQGELRAYEIKCSKTLKREMGNGLLSFLAEYPSAKASLLSLQEQELPLREHIMARHWSSVL